MKLSAHLQDVLTESREWQPLGPDTKLHRYLLGLLCQAWKFGPREARPPSPSYCNFHEMVIVCTDQDANTVCLCANMPCALCSVSALSREFRREVQGSTVGASWEWAVVLGAAAVEGSNKGDGIGQSQGRGWCRQSRWLPLATKKQLILNPVRVPSWCYRFENEKCSSAKQSSSLPGDQVANECLTMVLHF